MNDKDAELLRIVDTAISCCASDLTGELSITREDVIGKSRAENIVLTRTILVAQKIAAGYSTTTAAKLLQRDVHSIRYLMQLNNRLLKSSRAYRIAAAEVERKCKSETNQKAPSN